MSILVSCDTSVIKLPSLHSRRITGWRFGERLLCLRKIERRARYFLHATNLLHLNQVPALCKVMLLDPDKSCYAIRILLTFPMSRVVKKSTKQVVSLRYMKRNSVSSKEDKCAQDVYLFCKVFILFIKYFLDIIYRGKVR